LRQGNRDWQSRGLDHRIEVLQRWKATIATHRQAILDALTTDTGRYLLSAMEVDTIAPTVDRWRRLAPSLMQEQEGQSVAIPMTPRSAFSNRSAITSDRQTCFSRWDG
ncbi:MAG: hypothetical protein ACREEM_52380, partial [Blastocatellia bacterium]